MDEARVRDILERIHEVRVAVYGDFCLDAYWLLDPRGSEVSVETGLACQAVARHYYSLGGASNVVANLHALRPRSIEVIGVLGDDLYGRELRRQLEALGVDTRHLLVQAEDFDTVTFAKPHLEGREQARVDFGFFNQRNAATDAALLEAIAARLGEVDVLIVNQQVPGSIPRREFIDAACALFARTPETPVLLDSRHYGEHFHGVCRKSNDTEAARLNGVTLDPHDVLSAADARRYGQALFAGAQRPVFLTRGDRGILVVDAMGTHEIPGIQLLGRLDPVGAGDTVTSALALCLGAAIPPAEAAGFANFAAGVTVQKLYRTGTASGDEIVAIAGHADYLYRPELAEDPRRARTLPDTGIEVCGDLPPAGQIRHVVFDHDGTLSTLRQGWEDIMAPMMLRAILGAQHDTVEETLYHRVRRRVRRTIAETTGIQTILQMEALVALVREFGLVAPEAIQDAAGYKALYDAALLDVVRQRTERLRRGRLDVPDVTIKGGPGLLRTLRAAGLRLYLASGTDRDDVVREATALGYADLFDGGIHGALGDVTKYSKRMVIDRIMTENRLRGPELAVIGDGPVEIREARRRHGWAVGVASDEVRRHGLNADKRTRLIKAGAHLVCPDFSEADALLAALGIRPPSA